jgi:N-acetyl sugar amidotransferase
MTVEALCRDGIWREASPDTDPFMPHRIAGTGRYGLPLQVEFCSRCVISNQRPSSAVEFEHRADSVKQPIRFTHGVCDACRVAEAKASTDWDARRRELEALCDQHRSRDGSYDCIVPGSGGKDSYYAAHRLVHEFGMHPLLVTWAPNLYTEWGWRNLERWQAIAPHYLHTPSRRVHALLTRLAVENLFHPFQPFIIGQKAFAPKIAQQFGIDLVFYGENEAEYGNPREDAEQATRDKRYYHGREQICLAGVPVSELESRYGLTKAELEPYMPSVGVSGVQVHYLGYYLKWHPQSAYYYAVEHGGFECSPERTPGTWSKYNSLDDRIDDFHYWTTYQKFGIGRATYDAAQEIRSGDITREEGVALVKRFDGEWPARFAAEVNDYLSVPGFPRMTDERLHELAAKFRPDHLWDDTLRHRVWDSHTESWRDSTSRVAA